MIDKDKIGHLSDLVNLYLTCAEKGGTAQMSRVQAIVSDDLNELLTEIEEEKEKNNGA